MARGFGWNTAHRSVKKSQTSAGKHWIQNSLFFAASVLYIYSMDRLKKFKKFAYHNKVVYLKKQEHFVYSWYGPLEKKLFVLKIFYK